MGNVYWILVGPRTSPSARIHGYRIHEYLSRHGWRSHVLFAPPYWMWDPPLDAADFVGRGIFRPGDIVVCQKIAGPNTRSVLEGLRSLGVATVYIDCDLPPKTREASLATTIVSSSNYLANEYRKSGLESVLYIPDAYEWSAPPKAGDRIEDLRCVWFGTTPGNWAEIENVRHLLASTRRPWTMTTITDHPKSDVKWNLATAWRLIAGCDAAVIPGSEDPSALAKSSNRAIQAMALGLPVVAYPRPSYREVIYPGRNGFLCGTDHEWISAFRALENPADRARMSRCAYRFATRYFSIERIGKIWEAALAECGKRSGVSDKPEWNERREADFQSLQRTLYSRASMMLRNRVRLG